VIHALRALSFVVLGVLAACQATVPPSVLPTTVPTVNGSPGEPTSSGQPTTSGPAAPTPTPTPTPIVTINHKGDDESVVLEVPAPQIPVGVTIDVEDHPLQDAPRDVRDAGVRQAFHVLTPEDLTFTEPVRITISMPRAAFTRPDGKLALVVPAIRTPDGDWDWLADPEMTVSADTVEMTGLTSHLGSMFVWSDLTDLDAVASNVSPQPVGSRFRLSLGISPRQTRPNPIKVAGTPGLQADPVTVLEAELARGGPITSSPAVYVDATCDSTGHYTLAVAVPLENFGADTPFLTDTLRLSPTALTLNYMFTGECLRVVPSTPPPTASPTAPASSPSPSATPSSSASPSASPSSSPSPSPSPSPTPKSKPSKSP